MPAEVISGDVEGPWEVLLSYLAFLLPPGKLGDLMSVSIFEGKGFVHWVYGEEKVFLGLSQGRRRIDRRQC